MHPRTQPVPSDWRQRLARYRGADIATASAQVGLTAAGYASCWWAWAVAAPLPAAAMVAWWLLTAALSVRLFILQHDCMHGSLFTSSRTNVVVGYALSLVTLTPFHRWRTTHRLHHAHAANLDKRARALDIPTMTVAEYHAAPSWRRLSYQLLRHPVVLFGFLPVLVFLLEHRFARGGALRPSDRFSVAFTNAGFALTLYAVHTTIGLPLFLTAFVPMAALAASAGMWLFYVQHHWQPGHWVRRQHWRFVDVGLLGSTFYDLPKPLAWWTASIGYHHVHHLDPRIPNYRLAQCHREQPFLQAAPRLTLRSSLRATPADCWDEERGRMVRFAEIVAAPAAHDSLHP